MALDTIRRWGLIIFLLREGDPDENVKLVHCCQIPFWGGFWFRVSGPKFNLYQKAIKKLEAEANLTNRS